MLHRLLFRVTPAVSCVYIYSFFVCKTREMRDMVRSPKGVRMGGKS